MHAYIFEMNIIVDFVLNKNDRGCNSTRKTSWLCRSRRHSVAAVIKERKEETLCNKEQSSEQHTKQPAIQFKQQPALRSNYQ